MGQSVVTMADHRVYLIDEIAEDLSSELRGEGRDGPSQGYVGRRLRNGGFGENTRVFITGRHVATVEEYVPNTKVQEYEIGFG